MENKLVVTWNQFEEDCRILANKIAEDRAVIPGILAVTRGGLFVAGIISHLLNIRNVQTLCLESYSSCKKRQELIQHNNIETIPTDFLVVDDLVDSGGTLNYINNLGFEDSAVVYRKSSTRCEPSFFVEEMPADRWIVFPWE